jgi:8-oxo-dGTP pyrophosphatase MutT (NUDIX family)
MRGPPLAFLAALPLVCALQAASPARARKVQTIPASLPARTPQWQRSRKDNIAVQRPVGLLYKHTDSICAAFPRHSISNVDVRASGVVPYVVLPDNGVFFLLQVASNGTRLGQLCDFGGRREGDDVDVYATAARELFEETGGAFGSAGHLARELRRSSRVTILSGTAKYCTFFLKVNFRDSSLLPRYDLPDDSDPIARECRWYRSDELLVAGGLSEHPRMITNARMGSRWRGLSSFQAAVCETIGYENSRRQGREQWHVDLLRDIGVQQHRKRRGPPPSRRRHGRASHQRRSVV